MRPRQAAHTQERRPEAPAERPIRIVIADDQAATRAGLRLVLERDGFAVCAEASDARTAVEEALRTRPDLCLLDLDMPGGGIAVTAEITARVPTTAVVIFGASARDADLFDALRCGASGYLFKDTAPDRLPAALRGVVHGEAAIPRRLAARLVEEFRERGRHRRVLIAGERGPELTNREWEVLELLRQRCST